MGAQLATAEQSCERTAVVPAKGAAARAKGAHLRVLLAAWGEDEDGVCSLQRQLLQRALGVCVAHVVEHLDCLRKGGRARSIGWKD